MSEYGSHNMQQELQTVAPTVHILTTCMSFQPLLPNQIYNPSNSIWSHWILDEIKFHPENSVPKGLTLENCNFSVPTSQGTTWGKKKQQKTRNIIISPMMTTAPSKFCVSTRFKNILQYLKSITVWMLNSITANFNYSQFRLQPISITANFQHLFPSQQLVIARNEFRAHKTRSHYPWIDNCLMVH